MSETIKKHTFTIMDTPTLIRANENAVKLNQNRSVTDEFITMLDPDGTHVITFHMLHTNFEGTDGIRCHIYCKVKGRDEPVAVWIDVTVEEFNTLPTSAQMKSKRTSLLLRKVQ